jgi:cell division transport system permease protein
MSMTDEQPDPRTEFARRVTPIAAMGREAPIVPKDTVAGRALIAVVAIMTFLAALATGGTVLIVGTATDWQADVARELTIQIRPSAGRDIESDVKKAADIAARSPGVSDVRIYTKQESARLLEPWLGADLPLDILPVPRIIAVRLAANAQADLTALRATLAKDVAGASLDDHRGWAGRMRTMASTAVAGGVMILALVLAATILSVSFATRGAMAANRPIIEVLHFIGAKDGFIAGQFQRHFLILGLQGGLLGGGMAILVFLIGSFAGNAARGTAAGDQAAALLGTFSIGIVGYVAVAAQVALVALVTAGTSRYVVNRTLETVE